MNHIIALLTTLAASAPLHAKETTKHDVFDQVRAQSIKMCDDAKVHQCFKRGHGACQVYLHKSLATCEVRLSPKAPKSFKKEAEAKKFAGDFAKCISDDLTKNYNVPACTTARAKKR